MCELQSAHRKKSSGRVLRKVRTAAFDLLHGKGAAIHTTYERNPLGARVMAVCGSSRNHAETV
jgi:hypothetical protein